MAYLKVREVAEQLRVLPETVCNWIAAKKLKATNVASPDCRRKRWRIDEDDLAKFVRLRTTVPESTTVKPGRPEKSDVIEFF